MKALERAKELLHTGNYTCVICQADRIYTSTLRGVKPLVQWYQSGSDFHTACAADKVIGKATAFLYVLLGVKQVYAAVISQSAKEVLAANGIEAEYGVLVSHIINRKGDGICPFEAAVLSLSDPEKAYQTILEKMKELGIPTEHA